MTHAAVSHLTFDAVGAADAFARAADVIVSDAFLQDCTKPELHGQCEDRILAVESAFAVAANEDLRLAQEQQNISILIRSVQMQLVANERVLSRYGRNPRKSLRGIYERVRKNASTRAAVLKKRMAELVRLEQQTTSARRRSKGVKDDLADEC